MGKKWYSAMLSTMFVTLVLFIGFDVETGCACIDQDEMILRMTRSEIAKAKMSIGTYPTYDEVKDAVTYGIVSKYEGERPKTSGVFYDSTPTGDSYVLKRYAAVSFFGAKMPFVWEVD